MVLFAACVQEDVRLKNMKIFEVSLVDKAANRRPYTFMKRDIQKTEEAEKKLAEDRAKLDADLKAFQDAKAKHEADVKAEAKAREDAEKKTREEAARAAEVKAAEAAAEAARASADDKELKELQEISAGVQEAAALVAQL